MTERELNLLLNAKTLDTVANFLFNISVPDFAVKLNTNAS